MRVLVACEFSGKVRDAFLARGHDAWSCDLLPTESNPERHIQANVLDLPFDTWDLLIFHYPCTYLANSGVRWLFGGKGSERDQGRWALMEKDARNFRYLLNLPVRKIAGENPIQHKYAQEIIGHRHSQVIQPWQFGHGETKATCLWLKNLPPLRPTNIVAERKPRVHREPPSADRWKNRSRTLPGIAQAMAEQWG